jgi:catechol 2,3-dioxygenase-like lactoylglutathione lyase family enzyme
VLHNIRPSLRLDHVVIAVSDWERADDFYTRVLGAEIVARHGGGTAYRFGDQQLNVHGPGTDAGELVARKPVAPGNSDVCFAWEGSIGDAIEHLTAAGVEVIAGPLPREGGRGRGTSVYFRDPDGTLLELIAYDS